MNLNDVLNNKYVLNLVVFLSLLNIIGYIVGGKKEIMLYFILIGMIVAYFSQNMTLILGIPLILVNMIRMKEGVENMNKETETTKTESVSVDTIKMDEQKKDAKVTPPSSKEPEGKKTNESFEGNRKKGQNQYQIDYASTVEDAYDDLNKVLGGDGISKLTNDTQRLMQQQMQLAKAMENMGPMIEKMAPMLQNAQSMLSNMNIKNEDASPYLSSLMNTVNKTKDQK
jgi:hypothetical protein